MYAVHDCRPIHIYLVIDSMHETLLVVAVLLCCRLALHLERVSRFFLTFPLQYYLILVYIYQVGTWYKNTQTGGWHPPPPRTLSAKKILVLIETLKNEGTYIYVTLMHRLPWSPGYSYFFQECFE